MTPRITIRPRAVRDLEDHFLYLAERSREAALRFLESSRASFEELMRMPELGAVYPLENPSLAGVRGWQIHGFKKYLVFYRPKGAETEIIRV